MAEFSDIPYSGSRLPETLRLADAIAEKWSLTPLIVKMTREVCKRFGTQTREDEARAVREWIQGRVTYYQDPHGAEMVSDPLFTLQYGGDCDDQATLCACMLRSIGHDARICAVRWEGRTDPTHCVCFDASTVLMLDPISEPPETWPPLGFRVAQIVTINKAGELENLSGFFSKLHKTISKAFTKIFKPKTFLGKALDPFGLMDPKRNLNLGGRIADVVGTAALLAAGGYAVGAASGGTGAGFWATAGKGYAVMGKGVMTGAKFVGSKVAGAFGGGTAAGTAGTAATGGGWLSTVASSVAPAMIQAITAKQATGTALSESEMAYLSQATPADYAAAGVDMSTLGGSGGGGGNGVESMIMPEEMATDAAQDSGIPWGLLAVAGGVGLLLLSSSGHPSKTRKGTL